MDLKEYRKEIDEVDGELVKLFVRRMRVSEDIGAWKKENGAAALDGAREREKLRAVLEAAPEDLREETARLYGLLFELSRARQERILSGDAGERA